MVGRAVANGGGSGDIRGLRRGRDPIQHGGTEGTEITESINKNCLLYSVAVLRALRASVVNEMMARLRWPPTRPPGADQNGRSSSSASSASGKSSNDSLPLGAAAAAPTLLAGVYDDSDPSDRPESMISSRAVISVV